MKGGHGEDPRAMQAAEPRLSRSPFHDPPHAGQVARLVRGGPRPLRIPQRLREAFHEGVLQPVRIREPRQERRVEPAHAGRDDPWRAVRGSRRAGPCAGRGSTGRPRAGTRARGHPGIRAGCGVRGARRRPRRGDVPRGSRAARRATSTRRPRRPGASPHGRFVQQSVIPAGKPSGRGVREPPAELSDNRFPMRRAYMPPCRIGRGPD